MRGKHKFVETIKAFQITNRRALFVVLKQNVKPTEIAYFELGGSTTNAKNKTKREKSALIGKRRSILQEIVVVI